MIAVVMGAKTSQERFAGCKSMLDYGFANFALVQPEIPGENSVNVKLGTQKSVTAVPAEDVKFLLDKGQVDQVTTQILLEGTIAAPVSKGQKVGTLTVRVGEQVLAQVPMVATQTVPRLTWWDLFLQVLQRMAMAKS